MNEFIGTLSTEIMVKLNSKAPPGIDLTTTEKNKKDQEDFRTNTAFVKQEIARMK